MVQEEIIKVLEGGNVPMSRTEIADALSMNYNERITKLNRGLKQLVKCGEISFIEIDRLLALKFYRCKRKMRLYYL